MSAVFWILSYGKLPVTNGMLVRVDNTIMSRLLIAHSGPWGLAFCPLCANSGHYLMYMSFLGNDSNLLIVFYVQIMPDDLVMQLHTPL
ncbi:hypothetical protein A6D87_27690 [Klebsiella quasipneumoniae]|nr:hypothetical protein A6D87_27690 [Klebsiella quasipneumoniae]